MFYAGSHKVLFLNLFNFCFLSMIYRFLNDSPISVDLYADDTTLYSSAPDKTSLETNLQNVLDLVHIWCLENGMLINTEKTKLMLIASRQKRHTLIDGNLQLENNNLELLISSNKKIFGVHVDENLIWNNHFQQVSKPISSYMWLLSQIRTYLTKQHRLLYYNAYINHILNIAV